MTPHVFSEMPLVQPNFIFLWLSCIESFWTITQFSLPCFVKRHWKENVWGKIELLYLLWEPANVTEWEMFLMQKNAAVMNVFTILDDCIKPTPPSAFSIVSRPAGNYFICKRSNTGSPKLLKWSRENNFRAIYYSVLWQLLS